MEASNHHRAKFVTSPLRRYPRSQAVPHSCSAIPCLFTTLLLKRYKGNPIWGPADPGRGSAAWAGGLDFGIGHDAYGPRTRCGPGPGCRCLRASAEYERGVEDGIADGPRWTQGQDAV